MVRQVRQRIIDSGIQATIDEVPLEFGLHSDLMEPVARNFKSYLEKVDFKDVTIPVLSGMDGRILLQGDDIKKREIEQIVSPIQFQRVLHALQEYDLLVAVGPGAALMATLNAYYPEKQCVAINKTMDIEKLKYSIQAPRMET